MFYHKTKNNLMFCSVTFILVSMWIKKVQKVVQVFKGEFQFEIWTKLNSAGVFLAATSLIVGSCQAAAQNARIRTSNWEVPSPMVNHTHNRVRERFELDWRYCLDEKDIHLPPNRDSRPVGITNGTQ